MVKAKAPSPLQFAQELSAPQLKDSKGRLFALLGEYAQQHASLKEEWHQRKPELQDLVLSPPADVNDMEEMLRTWHEKLVEDSLRLDAGEAPLRLHWHEICAEVVGAGRGFGGLASGAVDFVLQRLLRRQGCMRLQRFVLQTIHLQEGDFTSSKRRHSKLTTSPAQRALNAIDAELEHGTERLRCLREVLAGEGEFQGSGDSLSLLSSSLWRGATTVLLRQMLLEETATKDLRQFLLQLQYLGFACRARIWRKSLEHRAVMETAAEGTAGRHRVIQSNLAPLLSVPLGPTNRKRLERTLQEWAQGFSINHATMQPDRGKTFSHQVGLCFSDHFEAQQQRWQFSVYPITTCLNGSAPTKEEDGLFLRPSTWAEHLPWKPRLAPEMVEQKILLDASYARRSMPTRVTALSSMSTSHRSEPTYARKLLDQAAADLGSGPTLKGIVEVPGGGGCAEVDSLLGYEMKTLELADAATAARRCNEKAEEPVGGVGAAEFASQVGEKMPQHLLRAYYLLCYLKSRSCRWQLLSVLNFFRFVQRRLLVASVNFTTELDEGRGSVYIGRDSDPSQRVEEKAQDKYWDISSRGLSRILRHCSLPFTDEAVCEGCDVSKLDKETFTKQGEETNIFDSQDRKVLHEAALTDLEALELDILKVGSYYIHKYEATRATEREIAAVDRGAVLYDLMACEVWFHNEKQNLVEVYLSIFEDTTDPMEQRILAQRMMDLMALRPRLDLEEPYFVEAYGAAILLLRARSNLLKELQQHQAGAEVMASKRAMSRTADTRRSAGGTASSGFGLSSAGSSARSWMPSGGLAHVQEGSTLSGGIATARQEGEMCTDGDRILCHNSCCLAWKAELILEKVHEDLAQNFQVPPVASTQLERACYVVAFERWSQHQEFFQPDLPPQEDPELQLTLLQDLAKRLLAGEKEKQKWRGEEGGAKAPAQAAKNHWVDSISMNESMHQAFEEVTEEAKAKATAHEAQEHLLGSLLAQLLESLELRSRLRDAAVEVQYLQSVLKEQAIDFGSVLKPLSSVSGEERNAWNGQQLTAALVTKSMGSLQENTSDALLMYCSQQKIIELREMLQHELAFRCLALACIHQNALLLDPQTRSKELSDISTIGLSRDTVASDGGIGVMRRLRDSLEISGHDKNHPHAQQQAEQDFLTSIHSQSEASRGSTAEDKQGAAIMDMSRYAQYLQQPARYLEPILAALSRAWTQTESMRSKRLLRFKLLRCSSLMLLRSSCDLIVSLQVASSSNELARMAMLIPKSITPFSYGDRARQLVERDAQVTNLFSLPNTFDALQLRSLPQQDLGALTETLAEREEDLEFEVELEALINCTGPAVVALQLLNGLAQLLQLRYATAMIDADPVCLLEAQRRSRSPTMDLEHLFRAHARSVQDRSESEDPSQGKVEEKDIDTGDLGRAGAAYEAMEDLCADLARLVARLHALGPENCRKPGKVLEVLEAEVRCAQRGLAVVLRRAAENLRQDEPGEACELRRWSRVVEEEEDDLADPQRARPWLLPFAAPTAATLPKLEPYAEETPPQQELSWGGLCGPALVARLYEEGVSYPAHLHPSLSDERPPLVAAIQGPYVLKTRRPAARILRLPWLMPGVPSQLLRLPLALTSRRRQELFRARVHLEQRMEALQKSGLVPDSDEAVYTEAEIYGLMLLRHRLSEALLAGHLGWSALPTDAEITAEALLALPPEEPAVPVEVSGAWELEPAAVRAELQALRKQLSAMVPALAQLILSTATERLSEENSALLALKFRVMTRTRTPPQVTEAPAISSTLKHDEALLTGGPFASQLDGLQPVAELLQKSTYVRMDNHPHAERAHVLKELHLNACIEDLLFGLSCRGQIMSRTREQRTQEMLGLIDHIQKVLEFRSTRLEVETIQEGHHLEAPSLEWLQAMRQSKEKRESKEARVRADVAARSVRFVFEVDRVHRCQRNLKAAAAELQSRLQSEFMDQVRSSISDYTGALSAEDGRFKENHCSDGEVMQERLRDLREHVTSELASLAAKNQAVQVKALQPRQVPGMETLLPEKDTGGIDFQALVAGVEDGHRTPLARRTSRHDVTEVKPSVLTVSDQMYKKLNEVVDRKEVYDLQMELQKLRDRQLLERIFHKFKCQALRQHFERKVQEQEATLESNSLLLGHLAEISRAEAAAANDFVRGAQEVADAEKRTEELGPSVDSNAEQKRRLAKWKKNKSKQLYHMKKGVRDHEMAGTMDVASLLQEIQSKQELVKMLQQNQKEFDEEVSLAGREGLSESLKARRAMMELRRSKDETFRELQELRAQMQRPDGAKNVEYWRSKVMELREEVLGLEEENSKLRVLLSMRENPIEDG